MCASGAVRNALEEGTIRHISNKEARVDWKPFKKYKRSISKLARDIPVDEMDEEDEEEMLELLLPTQIWDFEDRLESDFEDLLELE